MIISGHVRVECDERDGGQCVRWCGQQEHDRLGTDIEGNVWHGLVNGQDVLTTVVPTSISASSQHPTARQLVRLSYWPQMRMANDDWILGGLLGDSVHNGGVIWYRHERYHSSGFQVHGHLHQRRSYD